MRRSFPAVLLLSALLGASLAGDEARAPKGPAGDLIKQLADGDAEKVRAAIRALGRHRPAKDVVPALKALLKGDTARVRWAAAEALWRLEHRAADLVPVYAELLTAADADVRAASAWRLGRLGGEAASAVPVLAAALRDERVKVRAQVGLALANLGAWAKPALPALVRALGDGRLDEGPNREKPVESVRRSLALPALVELADDAIPLLTKTLRDAAAERDRDHERDADEREHAWFIASRTAHAFPAFGARAVAPLLRVLGSKDGTARVDAAIALGEVARFNGLPDAAAEKLEECLDDPDENMPHAAAAAVSWARPANAKAVAILVRSSEKGSPERKSALLSDLMRLCPHNEAARKALFRMLGDEDAKVAYQAYSVLSRLDLPPSEVLGAWSRALSHRQSEVRQQALWQLRRLGPAAKAVKPRLIERFPMEADNYCKSGILEALTAIDPDDPALVPLLIKSVDDKEYWLRYRAIECLGTLGPKAKEALPRLMARLFAPKPKVGEHRWQWGDEVFQLVNAVVRVEPGSIRTAGTLLKAMRRPEIRALHGLKNEWYMRDRLEDELLALLPAATSLLREALKDKDADVRRSAALVLLRAGLDARAVVPALMDGLCDGKDQHGEQARFLRRVVELLSSRTPVTPAITAAWCRAWQIATPEVRKVLEPGLFVLQPEARAHLLHQLAEAKSTPARRDLAHLLAHFDGQARRVVPILRDELRDMRPASRYAATRAIIRLGPDAAPVLPELVPLLSGKHLGMRAAAAQALGYIGRAAKPAVPALKAMLKDAKPALRMAAAEAISRIDPGVSEALAVFRDALVRQSSSMRWISFHDLSEDLPHLDVSGHFPISEEEGIARFGDRAVTLLADLLGDADLDEWSPDNLSSQCGATARVRAALLLARIGPAAHQAVPALTRAGGQRPVRSRRRRQRAGADRPSREGGCSRRHRPAPTAEPPRRRRAVGDGRPLARGRPLRVRRAVRLPQPRPDGAAGPGPRLRLLRLRAT